jgi:hypothetical protein
MSTHGVNLPEGIKHLHGALYLVPFDFITVSDKEPDPNQKGYVFSNPRTLTERGQADLMDKRAAELLRNDIRDRTLMAPFVCRWAESDKDEIRPQLVGGERRHRAVSKLRDDKTSVKDASTAKLNEKGEYEYEYRPADKVYEYVLCQIFSAKSDTDALALAYSENACRMNLTEGHDVAICQELRKSGASDEKIMEVMHKDAKWLRDTDQLIANLDEESLKDLIEDRIDRDSAKSLMDIEDLGARTQVRQAANAESEEDATRRRARYQKKVSEALEEQEIAAGSVADATHQGDEEAITEAKERLADADTKVKRTVTERDSKKAVTKKKHIISATKKVTGNDPTNKQTLRAPKIQEHYVDYLVKIIDNDGKCPEDTFNIDTNVLDFGLAIAKAIMSGATNCADVCRKFADEQ